MGYLYFWRETTGSHLIAFQKRSQKQSKYFYINQQQRTKYNNIDMPSSLIQNLIYSLELLHCTAIARATYVIQYTMQTCIFLACICINYWCVQPKWEAFLLNVSANEFNDHVPVVPWSGTVYTAMRIHNIHSYAYLFLCSFASILKMCLVIRKYWVVSQCAKNTEMTLTVQ